MTPVLYGYCGQSSETEVNREDSTNVSTCLGLPPDKKIEFYLTN